MDLNFLKNPLLLAIIAAAGIYLYMYLENKKKLDKNPKAEIQPIDFTTIGIVGVVTFFVAYGLFGFGNKDVVGGIIEQSKIQPSQPVKLLENQSLVGKIKGTVIESFDSNTYHLVGKNAIRIPQTDVFIDIAKF